jgi:hypothetical protein
MNLLSEKVRFSGPIILRPKITRIPNIPHEARDDPEGSLPDWQYHLRELAALGVEDERLAYLEAYLRRF